MNRENRWRNAILTNGERPLNSYVTQGGAINRILEVECGEKVYRDPQTTAELVKKNYGFAGREFVSVLKKIGFEEVERIQREIQRKIHNDEKMQKQSISLSIVLTADRIVTDHLFKDGQYISLDDAAQVLVDRNELSDNERTVSVGKRRNTGNSKCDSSPDLRIHDFAGCVSDILYQRKSESL